MRCRAVLACPALLAAGIAIWLFVRPAEVAELSAAPPPPPSGKDQFVETVLPLFTKYCVACHNDKKKSAGLSLEPYKDTAGARKARDLWEMLRNWSRTSRCPEGKPQPTDAERKAIVAWIDSTAIKVSIAVWLRDPGRLTIRRLNKTEYDNTIRDLVGVDPKAADASRPTTSATGSTTSATSFRSADPAGKVPDSAERALTPRSSS